MADETAARPQSQRKAARQKSLLDAACEVFGEQGYQLTTYENIAERAGVTRATLYLYYKSKEDLFRALVDSVMEARRTMIDQIGRIQSRDPAADVKEALRLIQLTFHVPRNARVHCLMSMGPDVFPDLTHKYAVQSTEIVRVLASIIAHATESGSFMRIDPTCAARVAILPASASVFWIAAWPSGSADDRSPPFVPEEFLAFQRDLLVRGLTVDADRSGASGRHSSKTR